MKKISTLFTLVAAAIATLTGCKDDFPKVPTTDPYLNLVIKETTVAVGSEGAIEVTLDRWTTDFVDVTITSNSPALTISSGALSIDPEIRKVETSFATNAVGEAIVEIESDFPGVRYTTKSIKINIVKPQLSISGAKTCATGANAEFTVEANMNVVEDVVINLTSSDPAKLTVPATLTLKKGTKKIAGTMTGVAAGEVNITFTTTNDKVEIGKAEDGASLNTTKVTVEDPAPVAPKANIAVATAETDLEVGGNYVFTISSDIDVTEDVTFTFTSSDPAVATVSDVVVMKKGTKSAAGVFTMVAVGKATITIATTNETVVIDDTKKSFEVTVAAPPAE